MPLLPKATAEDALQLATLSLPHGPLTVRGFSQAAQRTAWAVPELKIAFDCGFHVPSFSGLGVLAITHAHPDHLAGIVSYLATRGLWKSPRTRVFVPAPIAADVAAMLATWERLTQRAFDFELVPCRAGERHDLGHGKFLVPFTSVHVVPSLGYRVVEQRRKGRDETLEVRDVGLVAFTGDTTITCLDQTPVLYEAKILILECTFLGQAQDAAHAHVYGHVHLDEIAARAALFQNELLILAHFSARYAKDEILAEVERKLPPELLARTAVWVA